MKFCTLMIAVDVEMSVSRYARGQPIHPRIGLVLVNSYNRIMIQSSYVILSIALYRGNHRC